MYIYMYTQMCISTHVYLQIHVYVCIYIYTCLHAYTTVAVLGLRCKQGFRRGYMKYQPHCNMIFWALHIAGLRLRGRSETKPDRSSQVTRFSLGLLLWDPLSVNCHCPETVESMTAAVRSGLAGARPWHPAPEAVASTRHLPQPPRSLAA